MPTTYKVLGQVCPNSTGALDVLYTVPAKTNAVISSFIVCCVGGHGGTFTLSVAPGGAADALQQYVYGSPTAGLPIDAYNNFTATTGMTLNAGDVVRVRNISLDPEEITFQLFGSEIT